MSAVAFEALACHVQGTLPLASLSAASVTADEVLYRLDQRHGSTECVLRQPGLFTARGTLEGFSCALALARG